MEKLARDIESQGGIVISTSQSAGERTSNPNQTRIQAIRSNDTFYKPQQQHQQQQQQAIPSTSSSTASTSSSSTSSTVPMEVSGTI